MPEAKNETRYRLLEAIMDVIDEKIDDDELKEILKDSRESLEAIKQDFADSINGLAPEVKEGAGKELQLVYKFHNDWENAFQAVEDYFETKQKFDLIKAGEMVKRCSEGMNLAIEMFTNQALMVMGPTDIPHLNLLIDSAREVVEEGAPLDKLKKVTADEFIMAEGAKKELEFERKHYQYTEQELLIKAYNELQEAITRIGHFIKDGKKEMLDKGLEECKIVYPKIRELISLVSYKRMTIGPTNSPQANILLNMAEGIKKGSVNLELFTTTLKETEEDYQEIAGRFQAITAESPDKASVQEEIEKTMEGLELYSEAIRSFYIFLDSNEGLYLEEGAKELKQAMDILDKSREFFEDLSEREGKTPCAKCGVYNDPDKRYCVKCGTILPKAAGYTPTSTFGLAEGGGAAEGLPQDQGVPENLQVMFQAVNDVSEGKISLEEFAETINWMEGILAENQDGFKAIPKVDKSKLKENEVEIAEKLEADMIQAKELFEEAYRDWEESLDLFAEYLEVEDNSLLTEGVRIMWEGNKKLNKVQALAAPAVKAQEEFKQKEKQKKE
ncbi:MAG: hypothetical protein ACLFQV_04880 [Vulcanimicrobiota bacterium]